jgi:hypothetical protein
MGGNGFKGKNDGALFVVFGGLQLTKSFEMEYKTKKYSCFFALENAFIISAQKRFQSLIYS